MYVRLTDNLGTAEGCLSAGTIHELDDRQGDAWIRAGIAEVSADPPPAVAAVYARLNVAAGSPCLFLPHFGEFGHLVMTHLRIVHWHKASRKVVCCRPGQEVLFPSADSFITDYVDPVQDHCKVGSGRSGLRGIASYIDLRRRFPELQNLAPIRAGGLTPEEELVAINPAKRIPFKPIRRGFDVDVVIGTRKRDFCPEKNWPHWQAIADAMTSNGYSFAVIGARTTSIDLQGQVLHSGDYDTDAAIELLENCRLFIGSDTGSAHLAATVGAEMIVFREELHGHRDLTLRMAKVNRGRVHTVPGGWHCPALVIERAIGLLNRHAPDPYRNRPLDVR